MERLTKLSDNNKIYIVDDAKANHQPDGYCGEAVNKLAQFENICDDLNASQIEISKELERLRNEGKKNSVKFRELLVKKLTNSHVLSLFKAYGL